MCGISSYVGPRDATPIVLDGLARLEYRGYDSAGIVTFHDGVTTSLKKAGKLRVLQEAVAEAQPAGNRAIGHTRWATHGRPNDANAHPHANEDGDLAIVHNGIIENHAQLRRVLEARGHTFQSETDSEVLVHLIEEHLETESDLVKAVQSALRSVEGAYAMVVAHAQLPGLVVARSTSPLVLGLGNDEQFVASDVSALLPYTRRVIYLKDGETAHVLEEGVTLFDAMGVEQELNVEEVDWDADAADKGGWPHFMLKEIFEQPAVLQNTLANRFSDEGDDVLLPLAIDPNEIDRIIIVAAGTASYAGMVGEALLERLARIPSEVHVASEFRYSDPIVDERTLVIAVSQSGETIDTLEALREAKRGGAPTLGIVNVRGSSIVREVDDVVFIEAGPEIGVASTKAYSAMLAAFSLLALRFAIARGRLDPEEAKARISELRAIPARVEETLARRDAVREVITALDDARGVLYLGRGMNVASAFEGALKLKEITYIHAEAYATGEMKHGPIALIDRRTPVVALAPQGALHGKTLSNLQEVRARDGIVIAIASDGDEAITDHADHVLRIPRCDELWSPILLAVPMQFLAYETAVRLERDVDQPRNLAKSVTVE